MEPWDTTEKKEDDYCAHGKVTFGTWHRPYVLLYEQRLYEIMLDLIPQTFAARDQAAMMHAAKSWRLPFWDWASKKPDWDPEYPENPKNIEPKVGLNVPYLLTLPMVEVKTMTGSNKVPNPMWRFVLPRNSTSPKKTTFGDYNIKDYQGIPVRSRLHPFLIKLTKQYPKCKATSRQPRTYDPEDPEYEDDWVNGTTQDWKKILSNIRGAHFQDANTLPEAVYRLFSYVPSYTEFGISGWTEGTPPKRYSSLEDVHGRLHGLIGGSGQMGAVPVAAFDPVFW